jgi:hypothetical protein
MLQEDQDNNILCGGDVPEGATVRIAVYEKNDILKAARDSVREAMGNSGGPAPTAIIYSCATRSVQLGADSLAEMDLLREEAGNAPFLFAYAGGEICPIAYSQDSGDSNNKFHNQTFCICLL